MKIKNKLIDSPVVDKLDIVKEASTPKTGFNHSLPIWTINFHEDRKSLSILHYSHYVFEMPISDRPLKEDQYREKVLELGQHYITHRQFFLTFLKANGHIYQDTNDSLGNNIDTRALKTVWQYLIKRVKSIWQ
jgi:hypothetical protein